MLAMASLLHHCQANSRPQFFFFGFMEFCLMLYVRWMLPTGPTDGHFHCLFVYHLFFSLKWLCGLLSHFLVSCCVVLCHGRTAVSCIFNELIYLCSMQTDTRCLARLRANKLAMYFAMLINSLSPPSFFPLPRTIKPFSARVALLTRIQTESFI